MSSSPEPTTKTTKKRASAANDDEYVPSASSAPAPAKKRARVSKTAVAPIDDATNAEARALVARVLTKPATFQLPEEEDSHHVIRVLAKYARSLEGTASAALALVPPAKTPEQIEAAAEKCRKAARSQIKKQMTWKDSCRMGTSKWTYDGIAPDPETFASLMHLDAPATWKQKKLPVSDFEAAMETQFEMPVRYDTLIFTSDVNVRWNAASGEFKFSGTYGRSPR